jgi:hypothetical protein
MQPGHPPPLNEHVMAAFGIFPVSHGDWLDRHDMDSEQLDSVLELVTKDHHWCLAVPGHLVPPKPDGASSESFELLLNQWIADREIAHPGQESDHLRLTLFIPAYLTGSHFVLNIVDHQLGRITIYDPFMSDRFHARARAAAGSVNQWLRAERRRLGQPRRGDYAIAFTPADVPTQTDSVSCGFYVSACAYVYAMHKRLPTLADFSSTYVAELRHFVWHALRNKQVRPPVVAPPLST